jgi:hypothetical protein
MELEYELLQNDLIHLVREALISLQWDGMVTSFVGADGQIRWKLTAKGRRRLDEMPLEL